MGPPVLSSEVETADAVASAGVSAAAVAGAAAAGAAGAAMALGSDSVVLGIGTRTVSSANQWTAFGLHQLSGVKGEEQGGKTHSPVGRACGGSEEIREVAINAVISHLSI